MAAEQQATWSDAYRETANFEHYIVARQPAEIEGYARPVAALEPAAPMRIKLPTRPGAAGGTATVPYPGRAVRPPHRPRQAERGIPVTASAAGGAAVSRRLLAPGAPARGCVGCREGAFLSRVPPCGSV